MKISQLFALAISLAIFFSSCQEQPVSAGGQPEPFFDLKAYMEKQIEALNQEQSAVRKAILVDGQRETKQLDSLDYRIELKTFLNSDINRKAWVDKYTTDSTLEGSYLKEVTYTATAEKLKTRLLRIRYDQNEVSDIYIENRTNSIVADVRQELHFQPEVGYRLRTTQETVLSEAQEIEVTVKWE
ncbi:MAG: hypothetical protein RIC19_18730 [Phaeodactylibacter sp.]|uniref:hypothetical protein n=1 Tax=Phaeodactylibacter sp. TaxID=1940289 RepID=UPI0032EAF0B0